MAVPGARVVGDSAVRPGFFGAPVITGLVYAAVTGRMVFLLVLIWPALWVVMWRFP